ncbi:hypothetical protein Y1Q_0009876 [Alligator mississippiensis]|uniref:Uncharacterized protein n=1 Tax=Alligator mississippiensis TaxID=8496 RepID=A0A151MWZ0_ALLMI|nr:hypothetical protein Y1Q_0009876 [Alligator mississippiensis]
MCGGTCKIKGAATQYTSAVNWVLDSTIVFLSGVGPHRPCLQEDFTKSLTIGSISAWCCISCGQAVQKTSCLELSCLEQNVRISCGTVILRSGYL